MKTFRYLIYIIFSFVVLSCTYDFPEEKKPEAGNADFTKYVAVGNSLTAGYMDGALYARGQSNSYPSIIASQMKLVGGGDFNQPDINSVNGFYAMGPNNTVLGRLKLNASASPTPTVPGDLPAPYTGDKTKLNNFGVPGLTLLTAQIPATGGPAAAENPAYNPLYARFASNPGTSTLIGDAKAALANGGTFFSFWLGNNDVLGYATGGASNPAVLTSVENFNIRYNAALSELLSVANVNGVIANIPNVTDIPFFKTIPYNPIPLTKAQADQLNAGYAMFNGGVDLYNSTPGLPEAQKRPKIVFLEGKNGLVIEDEDLPEVPGLPKYRLATSADLVTLTIPQAQLATGLGTQTAVPDQYILTTTEIIQIADVITGYNAIISTASNNPRLAFVDINKIFGEVAKGTQVTNGINFTSSIAPPFGAFSLDGVHPNARGSAFVANQFITAINTKFGSSIPLVNPNNYPGNDLP
jgi:hypothetical protein